MWKKTALIGALVTLLMSACSVFGAKTSSFTGRVWEDINGNGLQDNGEPGIPNVQVSLRIENTVEYTSVTKEDGTYSIQLIWSNDPNLAPFVDSRTGRVDIGIAFELLVEPQDGYRFTTQGQPVNSKGVTATFINSDVDSEGRWSSTFDTDIPHVDAGLVRTSASGTHTDEDPSEDGSTALSPAEPAEEVTLNSVEVTMDVFSFSCRPTFDANNEIVGRTPGLQGLYSFDHPQSDQLLGGEMPVLVTDPNGLEGSVILIIEEDSSSGNPIGHFSFYDDQLPPGTFTFDIPGITTTSGANVDIEAGGSGETDITEQQISGCQ